MEKHGFDFYYMYHLIHFSSVFENVIFFWNRGRTNRIFQRPIGASSYAIDNNGTNRLFSNKRKFYTCGIYDIEALWNGYLWINPQRYTSAKPKAPWSSLLNSQPVFNISNSTSTCGQGPKGMFFFLRPCKILSCSSAFTTLK